MLDRNACERRVYRLAVLLTGDRIGATRVIEAVVGAQPDLSQLDTAHLDRLTVLRSREMPAGTLSGPTVSAELGQALVSLPPQQREAWVFTHVYGLAARDMARAMDCSITATSRHLLQANEAMAQAGAGAVGSADGGSAVDALLALSLELDVPEFYRERRTRRERMRRVVLISSIVLAVAAVMGVVLLLVREGAVDAILRAIAGE